MDLWLYVYGNGDFIYTVLTSVNFFMNHANSFFEVAAILSLLIFAVEATGVMPSRGYDWSKFIRVYLLISLFVLTPYPGQVNVKDVLTNNNYTFNFNNGKLPLGLIFPVAVTSDIMNRLINLYQQNFEIDENLNYTSSGMNFGANFIQSLDNVNSYDDKFNYNLDNYMQNCGFPILYKAGATAELRTSSDILATLTKYTSNARFVQQEDFASGSPIIKTCSQAIADIKSYYVANASKFMNSNAQMMGINTNTGLTQYLNSANAATSQLLGITQGASAALKQAIFMNMLMASLKNGAQNTGNGSLALAAYDAEQFQQYKKSSELSGAATARTIPILVGIAFALLFFLYPVMIFLAIAMGSYRAIGVFMQIVIAINLIPLIYEILNYISTYYLEKKLGTVIIGQGFTYDLSTSIYSFTDNMIIAGNYLATSAPIIAYAIVSGSAMALTSVFSHINDPAKNQAMQVGGELARGNLQMGNANLDNTSFNNLQGNKLDNQLITSTGVPIMKHTSPGGINTNVGGQNYDINYKSDLLVTPNFAHMASSSLQNSLSHNKQQMGQLSKQWGQQAQRLHDLSNNLQSGQGGNLSSGSEDSNALAHAQNLATSISGTFGTPMSGISGVGVSAGIKSDSSDRLSHNLSEYQRYANQLSHSSNQAVRDAFSSSNSLTTSSSRTLSEAIATSQALTDVTSKQSTISGNYSNDFNKYLREQGFNPNDMSVSTQMTAANQFVAQKLDSQYGIKTQLEAPSSNSSGIEQLANSQASNTVNSSNLNQPSQASDLTNTGDKLNKQAKDKIADFKDNQGDALGKQVVDQAKTAVHVASNAGGKLKSLVD